MNDLQLSKELMMAKKLDTKSSKQINHLVDTSPVLSLEASAEKAADKAVKAHKVRRKARKAVEKEQAKAEKKAQKKSRRAKVNQVTPDPLAAELVARSENLSPQHMEHATNAGQPSAKKRPAGEPATARECRFDELGLLEIFVDPKAEQLTFVKVGNTTAISVQARDFDSTRYPASIDYGTPFTPLKVRMRKSTKVWLPRVRRTEV